jgi:hypothetical protein
MWWRSGIEGWQRWMFGALVLQGSTHCRDCTGMDRMPRGSLPVAKMGGGGTELAGR